jgi:CRP-like cAMP-binding protein
MRKALFFLGCMTDSDIEWMMRNGARRSMPKGSTLIRQGEATDSLFFLLQGELAVSVGGQTVAVLKSGEVVGEISFVDSRPPTASIVTLMDCEVGMVPRRPLSAKLTEDMAFAAHFYQAMAIFMADRLRTANATLSGKAVQLEESIEDFDELAPHLLDSLSMAGDRFSRMQQRPWGLR